MTITAFPFEDQDTTETQYSQLFRELQDSGVADSIGGTGFAVTANASGMEVAMHAGFALLRGHAVHSTGVETVPIPAAGTATRIDRVVLRLDPAQNGIVPAVLQGVPGNGPAALTQTDTGLFELPLAQITVGPGVFSIAADKVADDRRYLGSRLGTWTSTTRPVEPRTGCLGLNITTGKWEYWDGSVWTDFAPIVNWTTIAGKPASFPPAAHAHPWASITDRPESFPPSAHPHSAADLTTGAVPIARIPTGTTASTVAIGNHNHGTPALATRSDGTTRAHTNEPANPGPWYAVWVDGNRNFCRNTSSARFKQNIRDHHIDPADVLALQPRLYDRKDTTDTDDAVRPGRRDEFGLIAEEVDQHLPELTIHDEDGRIDSVRYDLLAVALLSVAQDQQTRIHLLEDQLAGLQTAVKVLAGGE